MSNKTNNKEPEVSKGQFLWLGNASFALRVAASGGRLCCALLLALTATTAWAQKPAEDLTERSLEDLLNVEVTSVSKREAKLFQTAAAVYVITQEEIRRSGMTSLPELLRLAPGMQVARISGSVWAISARGFNGQWTNKLLVLIDGRSVYSPLFSGVYW